MFRRRKKPTVVVVRPGDMLVAVNLHSIGVETSVHPQKVADFTVALKEYIGLKGFVAVGEDATAKAIEDMVRKMITAQPPGHSHG